MKTMVNDFYDVATDFYEYGWGDSFHFYTIDKGASARDAIVKHQIFLAMKLALTPQDTVLVSRNRYAGVLILSLKYCCIIALL